jgi:hypothetical protein
LRRRLAGLQQVAQLRLRAHGHRRLLLADARSAQDHRPQADDREHAHHLLLVRGEPCARNQVLARIRARRHVEVASDRDSAEDERTEPLDDAEVVGQRRTAQRAAFRR